MRHSEPSTLARLWCRGPRQISKIPFFSPKIISFLLLCTLVLPSQTSVPSKGGTSAQAAQSAAVAARNLADPPGLLYQGIPASIPQDDGAAGLRLQLRRMATTGRLMQVVAHPDDEDGGMLTLEARGHGVNTLLMTLNRGEGGQNKIGSNLSDVLGVLRAEELLASDQFYGVQDRFSRVADFGFSKSADETFDKWGGHDPALSDMVRVIRTFRPDVLVARFSGTDRDGHGNHQASSILTREAFRAAADPKRFPEQIAAGLSPWQPKKLYIGNVCGFGATSCPDSDWTVKLNTGQRDDSLGMSYIQFALTGLRHQLSQGAANWTVEPGDRFTFYKLVESADAASKKEIHEKDFFDGIDTSLPGLEAYAQSARNAVPGLRQQLTEIARWVSEATEKAKAGDVSAVAPILMRIVSALHKVEDEIDRTPLSGPAKVDLLTRIADKEQQAETALNLALGVQLTANVSSDDGRTKTIPKESEALTTVSPGEEFVIAVLFHNGSKLPLVIDHVALEVPAGWNTINSKSKPETVKPGDDLHVNFRLRVPKDTPFTRPYWHRDDPDTESINHIDNEKYASLPFPPPALRARVEYSVAQPNDGHARNGVSAAVVAPFIDKAGKQRSRNLAVVPAFSVMLEPGTQVISTHNGSASTVTVGVTSNLQRTVQGELRLELPKGWRSDPAQVSFSAKHRGERQELNFKIFPEGLQQGRATIHAVLTSEGQSFSEGYTLVTREDLGSFYYYQPARQRVSMIDVNVPHELRVGYIMGAGDEIPTILKQLGMNVTVIDADGLGSQDLTQYGTVVLGIRAYDTQKAIAANNKRLLDYVSAGGTLIVQYNASVGDFNSGKFTPYPADLSRARVSVEDVPVKILAPDDSIFQFPNTISDRDFDGWVQERGLYFMDKWDDHFQPLLSCHDPGEDDQKGGLVRAQYGKGTYIYAGYAFFRQLPAGVPGAVRLFVNLLSAGHEKH